MGICDCNSKNEKDNLTTQRTNTDFRQTLKYFPKSMNGQKADTLILNNDVIVSDLGANIENKYEKLKKLGEGAYGEVWKVRHKVLGKEFAMKIIEKSPYCVTKEIIN
jgi:serine/threonine protein kinase